MPLRTKLLLYLTLLAIVPLILFGLTAYSAATTSLINVEHDNLIEAVGNANRALADIENSMGRNVADNANWDELHDAVGNVAGSEDFFKTNFDPSLPASTPNTFNLQILGVRDSNNQPVFTFGPVAEFLAASGASFDTIKDSDTPISGILKIGSDIYIVAYAPTRTSGGADSNGLLVFGRKIDDTDVAKIKELTGYDVALYQGQDKIAATQATNVTPAPDALQSAANGQTVLDQSSPDVALAYGPINDLNNKVVVSLVVWRPRVTTIAALGSIATTLVVVFVFGAILAVLVAVFLGRSITRPLQAMVDTADKVAAGDLTQRVITTSSRDELGRLANAFNKMAEKVAQRVTYSETQTARLQELDEFRLHLLTAISQALQAPVSTIRNHASSLNMAIYGSLNEAQNRSVDSIGRAAAMEEALLADLIDFSNAQQKALKIAPERLTLSDTLNHVAEPIGVRFKAKRIQLNLLIPPDLPPVFADRTRLEQILDTLLSWSYDYSVPNGRVTVSAVALSGRVQVSIADTSKGVLAQELPQLFDLFYHAVAPNVGSGIQRSTDGQTGLGLALAKALIEQHGGTIKIEYQPGTGNVFTFTLPSTS
jgi:signal transduction histidine kinase